jgi:hypothetical protein
MLAQEPERRVAGDGGTMSHVSRDAIDSVGALAQATLELSDDSNRDRGLLVTAKYTRAVQDVMESLAESYARQAAEAVEGVGAHYQKSVQTLLQSLAESYGRQNGDVAQHFADQYGGESDVISRFLGESYLDVGKLEALASTSNREIRALANAGVQDLTEAGSEVDALMEMQRELRESGLLADWLQKLSSPRRRTIVIVSLSALAQVINYVDVEAGINEPAHLTLLIQALLGIALLANMYTDE